MSKAKMIATRGVAWAVDGGGEVNRERGKEISDAPASVLAELTSTKGDDGVPYAVTLVEWRQMQAEAEAEAARVAEAEAAKAAEAEAARVAEAASALANDGAGANEVLDGIASSADELADAGGGDDGED